MGLEGCITPSEASTCCWLGLCVDCRIAYDVKDRNLRHSIQFGHWLIFIFLCVIGLYNLFKFFVERNQFYIFWGPDANSLESNERKKTIKDKGTKIELAPLLKENNEEKEDLTPETDTIKEKLGKDNNDLNGPVYPWFRLTQVVFCIGTGIFSLMRLNYHLSKPLLIFAALHNLCEYFMFAYCSFKINSDRIKFSIVFIGVIWLVICNVVMIPTFPGYVLAEQVTGITLDFTLPFIWFVLYKQNNYSKMFLIAFIAHIIHLLFTIIPLVIANFVVGQSYKFSAVLEFCIYMSSPVTHVLLTVFTSLYQKSLSQFKGLIWSDKYIVKKWYLWLLLGFILGLFPTVIIPQIIGECNH